jgi:NADH-quinone oxidoreductase subunit M
LGATLGLGLWRHPAILKAWLLVVVTTSLGTIGWIAGRLPAQAATPPLLLLLPLTAFASLLGQPSHPSTRGSWLLTLPLLGLGLGVLASETPFSLILLVLLLASVGLMLVYSRQAPGLSTWWGIGTFALGVLAAGSALMADPPIASVAVALACATALPLMPFHKGYVAALTTLPGNLPVFLALVLPIVGLHGLLTALPQLPDALMEVAGILALLGTLYGSLRALTQSRAPSVVAFGGLAFLSMLWWFLLGTRSVPPQSHVYLSGVGLATSGLLLAWYQLRARYGEIGLRALSGLARPMPRFAIGLSLLALAALGLPPFGVYAGFIGMLLAPSFTWSAGVIVILTAWLAASWYTFELMQGLLFGRRRPGDRHEDLHGSESASLAIVLMLLVALGILPPRFFSDLGPTQVHRTVVMEFPAWNR